ncbi:hypothetical protein IAU60_000499 [Kwoniella sp. DSM 27419]
MPRGILAMSQRRHTPYSRPEHKDMGTPDAALDPALERKPDIKPNVSLSPAQPSMADPPKKARQSGLSRRWTSEELLQLFEHAMKNVHTKWEGAVPGRTANQCAQTWGKTLVPFIKDSIRSKGA